MICFVSHQGALMNGPNEIYDVHTVMVEANSEREAALKVLKATSRDRCWVGVPSYMMETINESK